MEVLDVYQFINRMEASGVDFSEYHVHHTYAPDHDDFNGTNGLILNQNMRRYHMEERNFQDIAQHGTALPDGNIVTGRSFGTDPASISGQNDNNPLMIETLGNFDMGHDQLEGKQRATLIILGQWFEQRGKYIRFHNENAAKSCPGTGVDKDQFMADVRGEKVKGTKTGGGKVLLRNGDSGSHVKKMQRRLQQAGFKLPKHGADGDFGDETEETVRSFQEKYDLKVDGVVGPETNGKLKEEAGRDKTSVDQIYKVQIGAFEDKGNSEELAKELEAKGFDTYIVKEGK
ncbi:peptidoglycan-binding protein [Marinococcus luteus]|uniref:peptidoglycan-binding protein n=1 Tax=Marinococcus luteus TaxID=1122204 RepID=UPI002ACD067D|nr:peptidoglycan-binding protein [Marinococcus luteus]MDZ5782120.1 peptidoglycan-binding protein [Marinococcus luteus]